MSVSLEQVRVMQDELLIRDALSNLSKDALTIIRRNASVKNVSKLNREQLLEALIEQLPIVYKTELMSLLYVMDDERITLLEYAASKNGIVAVTEDWTEQMTQYWQELGLMFKHTVAGREAMAMPVELIPVVKEVLTKLDRKIIERNSIFLKTIKGMMYYYGALTHEQVKELRDRYPMFEQLQAPYMHIIVNYRHYRSDIGVNDSYVYHNAIPDPTLIIKEQSKREDVPHAMFTALQLQQAGEEQFVLRTQAHQMLVDMLMKNFHLPKFEANLVADQSEFGIRAGLQLQDLVDYMNREMKLTEDALNMLLPRLIIMYNNTPQWCLKGHSANELTHGTTEPAEQDAKVNKANLGRNDLCYCGSGKKYKKCCMNA